MSLQTRAQAFTKLQAALAEAVDELRKNGASAFSQGSYDLVGQYAEEAKQLEEMGKQVSAMASRLAPSTAIESVVPLGPTPPAAVIVATPPTSIPFSTASHGPGRRLKVTFAGGHVIEENTATRTFVQCLLKMDLDRVAQLNKKLSGAPLVTKNAADFDYQGHAKSGGWYVCTHSNTRKKKELLEEVADRLRIRIGVEIID